MFFPFISWITKYHSNDKTRKINTDFFSIAHDIGTVTLQVVIDGRPVSTTAIFEYRQHEFPLTISSLTMPHSPSLLKFHLLQKLDTLEDYLQPNNGQQSDYYPLVRKMFSLFSMDEIHINRIFVTLEREHCHV